MRPELLKRYAAPVPRYTSYPTAPHFSNAIDGETYGAWLGALDAGLPLSLYVHIPFCNEMCWYCGCSTKVTRQHAPIARYLEGLMKEIDTVSNRIGSQHDVTHIHWGGGSPSILPPEDILALASALKSRFALARNAEFAVEIDSRGLDEDRIAAFAQAGVNRVSVGVQDFHPDVQRAINRIQSFELTSWVVDTFRKHGIGSINVDLVYGLPFQTLETLDQTMDHVLALKPDRIALFGYAHLPSRITHQRLIDESALPDTQQRFLQANRAAERLVDGGYVTVGLDHYARPDDPLASGNIRRNFQGYTTDDAAALIGLGASSIGRLPQGYVQNATPIADYERRVSEGGLATVRGHALSVEDAARALVIERLMCDFTFPAGELRDKFGAVAEPIIAEAAALCRSDTEDMVLPSGEGGEFRVTDKGRIFVRSICARFDTYLGKGTAKHSAGV
ncbi:MAG: oxygen-independent coproporphyrinogen III oxidase [Hyphomicrobiaceae bacterium]|nr:oxygen-independent coproporphyrinogen III oxidase [Hyphomicrobiaceae bacterium]